MRIGVVGAGLVALVGVAQAQQQPSKRLPDLERGEELYLRHCVQCHGALGAGNGPAAAALVASVPDLSAGIDASRLDPLAKLVLEGRGAMPGFEMSFDRYDARRALRYLDQVARGVRVPGEKNVDEAEEPEDDEDGPE